MARLVIAALDDRGTLHRLPEAGTKADLAKVLGRVGEGNGLEDGLATRLIENRHEIERVFAEHDAMEARIGAAQGELDKPLDEATEEPADG